MCWIGYCPPGVTPTLDVLNLAIDNNGDGSGWSIATPRGLEVVRSLDGAYAVSSFLRAREQWPNAHAVFHARYATYGTLDESNVHPFMVPGQPWAMAHNGMLPLSDGPFTSSGRSDSRILAEDVLSKMGWNDLRSESTRGDLESWLQGDKVVLLSGQAQKGGPVLIFNEDRGRWAQDGVWHSSVLTPRPYYGTGVLVATAVKGTAITADEDWWADTLDQQALESALASEEAREYRELLDKYDRGVLTNGEWDVLEAYEDKAYGILTEATTSLKVSA